MIALLTMFRGDVEAEVELQLDGHPFRLSAAGGRLRAASGRAETPDAVIATEPGTLATVLWHGEDPARLAISGDRALAERFLRAFAGT